jgi:hypothetical protein
MDQKQKIVDLVSNIISTYYYYAHFEGYYIAKNRFLTENDIEKAYKLAQKNKHEFVECAEFLYDIINNHTKITEEVNNESTKLPAIKRGVDLSKMFES